MAEEIDLRPIGERGPGGEAAWREDIRRAAVAAGVPDDQARELAATAPNDLPAFRGSVEHALYYSWARKLAGREADRVAYWPLLDPLAKRWPNFRGMAARWTDTSGMSLVSRAEDRR